MEIPVQKHDLTVSTVPEGYRYADTHCYLHRKYFTSNMHVN